MIQYGLVMEKPFKSFFVDLKIKIVMFSIGELIMQSIWTHVTHWFNPISNKSCRCNKIVAIEID